MDNGTTVPRPHTYVCPLNWSSSTHLPLSGSSSRPPHSPERVPSAGRGGVCREKEGGIERERERVREVEVSLKRHSLYCIILMTTIVCSRVAQLLRYQLITLHLQ